MIDRNTPLFENPIHCSTEDSTVLEMMEQILQNLQQSMQGQDFALSRKEVDKELHN